MKPIGYWLNRTDLALTTTMNAMLAGSGLTRLTWQVLNVLEADPQATDTTVRMSLTANASPAELADVIATVLANGWVVRPAAEHLALTEDGRARLSRVGERVAAFREASVAGVSPEEYRTAVAVLEQMTLNVESGQGC
ncbi:MarR family winged helix-turn-helix transcriptional regulator [Kitasatospora purpeofusca]|uniref:MarR family winged helix-turn-helix transcriptional regulator n=1 Tax=Kitasatospora purpeofusca TaxID=67352 RepID=UPI0004C12447|nr:MarR family winged helix-turn-helix transcriptional regulator [Kitasatospora purpeofusca]